MEIAQYISSLIFRECRCKFAPYFGEYTLEAVEKPVNFRRAPKKNSSDNQPEAIIWVSLCIGDSQSTTPGATKQKKLRNPQMVTKPFDIVDQMSRRIVG